MADKKSSKIEADEIVSGLTGEQKTLPSKYFYDERGSELFERICALDEYYPTDAEVEIMSESIGDICNEIGENVQLIELGSGSSMKTRLLLNHLTLLQMYVPVDISGEFLEKTAEQLRREYRAVSIMPVAADYTAPFPLPSSPEVEKRVVYYPGSTIGNFTRQNARQFLKSIAGMLSEGDGMLVGVDLKKDVAVIEAAYNDSKGVTAAFNKNILHRLNRELDANFDIDSFRHEAVYNKQEGRIEMHLLSDIDQSAEVCGSTFHFSKGETIHTENSYKYTVEEFEELAEDLFVRQKTWTDKREYFSVHYFKRV
ncbi:MAG: L-histidine N(alpha)-methyltransferase [Bacteroidota bacterium]